MRTLPMSPSCVSVCVSVFLSVCFFKNDASYSQSTSYIGIGMHALKPIYSKLGHNLNLGGGAFVKAAADAADVVVVVPVPAQLA